MLGRQEICGVPKGVTYGRGIDDPPPPPPPIGGIPPGPPWPGVIV